MAIKKNLPDFKTLWKNQWDKIIFLVIFGLIIFVSPGQNFYTTQFDTLKPVAVRLPLPTYQVHPYPDNVTGIMPSNEVSATGVIVLDIDSGVFLFQKNEKQKLSPASTTKLLTALVILDHFKLDDIMTVKTLITDGQTMGLSQGEKITVENLLYGALIHSGNDAAYTLADNYPGGVSEFVKAMNTKANNLHLSDSNFTNPVGYDDPNHKMSPRDLALLAAVALSNNTIAKMVAIPAITISDVTYSHFHNLKNVNELLGKIPGVGGIKTGWTEEAGENLVTYVSRNNHKIIFVVLQSKDRFGDSTKLIDWVFNNFAWKQYKP
jgi:serine-type D-Ala-D-Ala carboxypeptidase (penicillin-binding protein 5/6)